MEVPLPWAEAQLNADVDGCDHGEEVCVGNPFSHCVGQALSQVDDLQYKFTSVGRVRLSPWNCWWRLKRECAACTDNDRD